MTTLYVVIQDEVRDRQEYAYLVLADRIDEAIDKLVKLFQLPRFDFTLRPVDYKLIRAESGEVLPPHKGVEVLGLREGEVLRLVSPEGRRVWQRVRDILDEIEEQLKDQVKDRIQEELEKWVKEKLEEVRRTQAAQDKLKAVEQKYQQLSGQVTSPAAQTVMASRAATAAARGGGSALLKIGIGLFALAVVGGIAVVVVAALLIFGGVRGGQPGGGQPAPPAPPAGNPDRDGDGLSNDDEDNVHGTDPDNPDSEGDGLWDGDEVQISTDPWNGDTDGDGYGDGEEVHEIGSNPLDPDDPGEPGEPGAPGGDWARPVVDQGYAYVAILQVLNAPSEGAEMIAASVYEAGGEVATYEMFRGENLYENMKVIAGYGVDAVLLYAQSAEVIREYERQINAVLFEAGLADTYFYAIYPDGSGEPFYEP